MTASPFTRPVVRPPNPARVLNGRIVRPGTGIDWLLFGLAPFVAPAPKLFERMETAAGIPTDTGASTQQPSDPMRSSLSSRTNAG